MREHAVTHALCIGVDLPAWPEVLAIAHAHANLLRDRRRASGLRGHAEPAVADLVAMAARTEGRRHRGDGTRLLPARRRSRVAARALPHATSAPRARRASRSSSTPARRPPIRSPSCARSGPARRAASCTASPRPGTSRRARSTSASTSRSRASSRSRMRVELKDVARRVPLDRMLIETDSPYLAPVPYRGKRNQPASYAMSARRSRGCAASPSKSIARRDVGQLLPPVQHRSADDHVPA